jgi:hypothetical protein
MSKWSHLPNAEHVDRVLAHVNAHPEKWTFTRSAAWNAAYDAAYNAAYNAAWEAARDAVCDATWSASHNAASGSILALIANDTCGYLLREKIEHVELLASLGQPEAILLLPAVRAMSI